LAQNASRSRILAGSHLSDNGNSLFIR